MYFKAKMTTVGIMQPYFLPYIGYFQLMNAVDTFIFYDDVTYIKQGWINRNRILLNGVNFLFTLELKGASSFKKINEIEVGNNRNKLLKTFHQAYRQAPFFEDAEPLLDSIFNSSQKNLSEYIISANQLITSYLDIKTRILVSSEINKNESLKGQEKVIEICKKTGATAYINAIGGQNLYSKSDFSDAGISLSFIQSRNLEYEQSGNEFIPWLSIIDVIMYNPISEIKKMLDHFDLI
jgi:hypothetical protein